LHRLLDTHACSTYSLFSLFPPPPRSPLFPYTTLFRSRGDSAVHGPHHRRHPAERGIVRQLSAGRDLRGNDRPGRRGLRPVSGDQDRKSTRLNSSHVAISYAVFCLKKKKQK